MFAFETRAGAHPTAASRSEPQAGSFHPGERRRKEGWRWGVITTWRYQLLRTARTIRSASALHHIPTEVPSVQFAFLHLLRKWTSHWAY